MQRTKRTIYYIFIWFMLHIPGVSGLYSQNLVVANSADYRDAKSVFINPAILPFQQSKLMAGMKVFHVGFMPEDAMGFRNNYFSLISPFLFNQNLVVGMTGQFFGLPIYQQSQFSFNISHRPFRSISLGLKYNIFTYSYDKSNFDQIDQYDPVFSKGTSKTAHSIGVGLVFFPKSNLNLAISWDHINQPDVSLANDGIKQPYQFDFGVRYSYKFISTTLNVNVLDQSPSYSCMVESYFPGRGIIRMGYGTKSAKLEGQLNLVRGFSLIYGYEYPLFDFNEISTGSHQLCFVYDFAYNRFHIKEEAGSIVTDALISDDLFVTMSDDRLQIMKKKMKRDFCDQITNSHIELLMEPELGEIDSSQTDEKFFKPEYKYGARLSDKHMNPKLTENYQQYLQKISAAHEDADRIQVLVTPANEKRLQGVAKNLQTADNATFKPKSIAGGSTTKLEKGNIQYFREIELMFPEKVTFHIKGDKLNYVHNWLLEIYDYDGHVLRTFQSPDDQFPQIEWDWRDAEGNLLPPDTYFYLFRWRDVHGNLLTTRRRDFSVEKIVRSLNVEVLSKPKNENSEEGASYLIKLHN